MPVPHNSSFAFSPSLSRSSTAAAAGQPHIGIIINSVVPGEGAISGGTIHMLEVIKRWQRLPVRIVCFASRGFVTELRGILPGVECVEMPAFDRRLPGGPIVPFLVRAFGSFRRRRELDACDALVAASPFLPDVVPLLFARRPRRIVHVYHVLDRPWRRPGNFFWNVAADAAERLGLAITRSVADRVVTLSHFVAGQLYERGFRQPHVVTVCGIEPIDDATAVERSGAILVARLHPTKGVADAIRAWRQVVAEIPSATLTVIGSGDPEYVASLHELVERLGLASRVILTGRISSTARDAALQAAAMFVFPSYEEGWGIALAEAMRAGLPCVTYDLPVYREIFPEGRISVAVGNVSGLAAACLGLLRDPHRRDEIGSAGSRSLNRYTWEAAAEIDAAAIVSAISSEPSSGFRRGVAATQTS